MTARRAGARGTTSAALAVAMLMSACGGPSPEVRFRDEKLRPVQERIDKEKTALSGDLQTARVRKPADARTLRRRIARLGAAMAALEPLEPPKSVADELQRYEAANGKLIASLKRLVTALRRGSGLEQAGAEARDAAGAVQRARNALDESVAK